jgi:DNA-binding response OmpR family regulator
VRGSRGKGTSGWYTSGRTWYLSVRTEQDVGIDAVTHAIRVPDDKTVRFVVRDFAPDARLLVGHADWIVQTVARARQTGDWLPTIGVVRNGADDAVVRILAAGADDCVIPPTRDERELRTRLCAVLRRSRPDAGVRGANIQLDQSRSHVRVGRLEARLTRKQFAILSYLANRHGTWVHTAEIIHEVCQTHHAPNTSLVRVQIHGIRRALGPARDSLQSNGHGSYRLILGPCS